MQRLLFCFSVIYTDSPLDTLLGMGYAIELPGFVFLHMFSPLHRRSQA
jgi:hypothetical protein